MEPLHRLRRALEPVISRAMHFYWRFSRAATLGARAMVIDGKGRIFLIKHSYVDGWHLPGGGVETGETFLDALARELLEEGNIRLGASPPLFGVYLNKRTSRRDHVAMFIVRDFLQDGDPRPIVKSWHTDSSTPIHCRTIPAGARAHAWPKCSATHRSASSGEDYAPKRPRS